MRCFPRKSREAVQVGVVANFKKEVKAFFEVNKMIGTSIEQRKRQKRNMMSLQ